MSNGIVTVQSTRGRLAGHFQLGGFSLQTDAFKLSVGSLDIRLVSSGLLRMMVVIDTVDAEDATLTLPPQSGQMDAPAEPLPAEPLNLPVGIEINRLTIKGFTLFRDLSDPVFLDNLRFSGSVQRDRAVIENFSLRTADASLEMDGEVEFSPVQKFSAKTSWSFELPGMSGITGRGRLDGTFTSISLSQEVTRPFNAAITGGLAINDAESSWHALAEIRDLDPGTIFSDSSTGKLTGRVNAEGSFESFRFGANLNGSEIPGFGEAVVNVVMEGLWNEQIWELKNLTVKIPGSPGRLVARGSYSSPDSIPAAELESEWEELHWPLITDAPFLRSPAGEIMFSLAGSDYTANIKGTLSAAGNNPGPFHVKVSGNGKNISIEDADISAEWAKLSGRATLADSWNGTYRLEVADIGAFISMARGDLIIEGDLQGTRGSPEIRTALLVRDLVADSLTIEKMEGTIKAAMAGTISGGSELTMKGVKVGSFNIDHIALTGGGSAGSHSLEAKITSGPHTATARLDGQKTGNQWEVDGTLLGIGGRISTDWIISWADSLSWNGNLSAIELKPEQLWPGTPSELEIEAHYSGIMDRGIAKTSINIPRTEGLYREIPFSGSAEFNLLDSRVELTQADLAWASASLRAMGALDEDWDIDLTLEVNDLSRLVEGGAGKMTARGRVTGPRPAPILDVSLDTAGLGFPNVNIDEVSGVARVSGETGFPLHFRLTSGPVTAGSVTISEVEIEGASGHGEHQATVRVGHLDKPEAEIVLKGRITGQSWNGSVLTDLASGGFELDGSLAWKEGLTWRAEARGYELDPGAILTDWPGSLNLSAFTEGSMDNGALHSSLNINSIEGTLRGVHVSGTASFSHGSEGWQAEIPSLAAGGITLKASLRAKQELHGSWSLNIDQFGELFPDIRGSLRSTGVISGASSAPSVMGSVLISSLGGTGWEVDSVATRARIDEMGRKPGHLTVAASGLSFGQIFFDKTTLEAVGTSGEHEITLDARHPEGGASLHLAGKLEENSWLGTLDTTDISFGQSNLWSLDKNANFSFSASHGVIDPFCIASGDSSICTQASWKERKGKGSLSLTDIPVSILTPSDSALLKADGYIKGEAVLENDGNRWRGTARFSSSGGSVLYPAGFGRWAALNFGNTALLSTLDDKGLYGSFETTLGPEEKQDRITLEMGLPGIRVPLATDKISGQAVVGKLRARLSDMGFFQAFVPDVENPNGILTASMDLSGTVGAPVLEGSVSLNSGSAKVPLLGLSLDPVEGRLTGDRKGDIALSLTAGSGKGQFTVTGTADALSTKNRTFQINIKGENFTAAKTPIISMVLSPDLLFSVEGDTFSLTGTVRVPEAELKPKEIPVTNTTSSDVIVVDAAETVVEVPKARVVGDVTLILEDKVSFEGFGLTGRLSGTLRILEEPGKVTSGTGELTITDGQYRAYGQKLTIERGKLIFSGGPVDNPGLDIRAARRSGDVVAGVQVGGTIMAPEVSLYSDPAMDQADALSYLLLGKPLRRASGNEGQILASAALTMGLGQGEALAGRIGRAFGFEEVTIQTESEVEESALVVGRYLTPQVYVRYGVGLFQAFSLFQFGYHISDRFLLQGESGAQTGTDLFYTIEK